MQGSIGSGLGIWGVFCLPDKISNSYESAVGSAIGSRLTLGNSTST